MHFHENHATTLSEHHIFKEKGITENKVDYVCGDMFMIV